MSRRARLLRALPWIGILSLIAVVQLIRGAPIDAVVFALVAVMVSLDAAALLPDPPALPVPFIALATVVALGALALAFAPRHSFVVGIVVVAIGIGAVLVAWAQPKRESRERSRRVLRGAVLWASITVVLCLWELASFLLGRYDTQSKLTHPAISDLLDPVLDTWPGRVAFVVAWLAAGAGLLWVGRRR